MTLTSDLCVRVLECTQSKFSHSLCDGDFRALEALAEEGNRLRSDLSSWKEVAKKWPLSSEADHQMTIAWIFYSAISIYLSGIYDYAQIWRVYHITTPSLAKPEIQMHVSNILEITSAALKETNVTGLVFLFPLRIAGARVKEFEQQKQIRRLLAQISFNFKAANAFSADLEEVWANTVSNTITAI